MKRKLHNLTYYFEIVDNNFTTKSRQTIKAVINKLINNILSFECL